MQSPEGCSSAPRGWRALDPCRKTGGCCWKPELCEQSILQGYCVCIIDPEGDYRSLEALPSVITLGGDDPPPGAEEAHGQVRRFQLAPRLTSHVRHRTKYLDMPVLDSQAFVFTGNGRPGARARTLKEFTALLSALPADRLAGHLRRHDLSRWIEDVFRDRPLAAHIDKVEAGAESDDPRDVADSVAQAIRARYETAPEK